MSPDVDTRAAHVERIRRDGYTHIDKHSPAQRLTGGGAFKSIWD